MDNVQPIAKEKYTIGYSRKKFQPLLDALDKGDFELAKALAPEGYRLCGYQEFKETTTVSEYGKVWAGHYADVNVPAGRYPVFAREFDYHETKHCYTNNVKDYPGLLTWVEGKCIASSDIYDKPPFSRVIVDSPYAHSVAHGILTGNGHSSIQLIPPFEAKAVPFVWEGKQLVTYDIMDTSLPEYLNENPVFMRNGGVQKAPGLESMIAAAFQKTSAQGYNTSGPEQIR